MLNPTPLARQTWAPGTPPKVSICCMTYNQVNFIREAIEGFLMQETNFPVEIIVHDDASTDGTADIVREYEAKYPNLFKTILQHENQLSKGGRPRLIASSIAKGRFVALCEGDDFWTRTEKLQLQIELLESHPDAAGCFHRADGKFEEEDKIIPGHFGPDFLKERYDADDLLIGDNFIPTASMVLRTEFLVNLPVSLLPYPHGDIFTWVGAALQRPLLYVEESMSVYRKHGGGVHTGQVAAYQLINCIQTQISMSEVLGVGPRTSFVKGVERRIGQLKDCIDEYENKIRLLEERHAEDQKAMQSILSSGTYRGVRLIARMRRLFSSSGKI